MAFEVTSTGMYTGWWMILTGREKPSCSFTEQLFNLDSLSCKKMQQVYIYIFNLDKLMETKCCSRVSCLCRPCRYCKHERIKGKHGPLLDQLLPNMHHLPEGIEMPELVFAARSSSGRAIRAIQRYCGLLPSQFWAWFFHQVKTRVKMIQNVSTF